MRKNKIIHIQRFGQVHQSADMLNLVYQNTRDEAAFEKLSSRMRDKYNIFRSLPDVIEDDRIEEIELLDAKLSEYIDRKEWANAFDLRYDSTIEPSDERWELCTRVLSRRDIMDRLSSSW